jgi:hypothetical protein
MSLTHGSHSVHATDVKIVHPAPDDPRVEAFLDFLAAVDAGLARGGIEASRRLRARNISVVLLPARGQGATR